MGRISGFFIFPPSPVWVRTFHHFDDSFFYCLQFFIRQGIIQYTLSSIAIGRTFKLGEGWQSGVNAVRLWHPQTLWLPQAEARLALHVTAQAYQEGNHALVQS